MNVSYMVCIRYSEELPPQMPLFDQHIRKLKSPVRLQTKRDFKHYSG